MVELQPSKLVTWVRFPSPALSDEAGMWTEGSMPGFGSEVHPRISNSAENSRISLGCLELWGETAECVIPPKYGRMSCPSVFGLKRYGSLL